MMSNADIVDFRCPLKVMPMAIGHGANAYYMPAKWLRTMDERYVGLNFITRRQLFGLAYRELAGHYFDEMREGSGVLIAPFFRYPVDSSQRNVSR